MKSQLFAMFALAAAVSSAHAQTDVFLCVDGTGKKEYKNTGETKGCKKIDLPSLTMVPAPPAAKKTVVQTAAVKTTSASTPSDFPKVDADTQKARDSDRKQILMDEVRTEEQKLANLKKEFNNGEPERHGDERNYAKYQERVGLLKDDIGRTEKNIEALKRELANIK